MGEAERANDRQPTGGSASYGSQRGRANDPGEQLPRHDRDRTRSRERLTRPSRAEASSRPGPRIDFGYGVGNGAGSRRATAPALLLWKSRTDATAIQSSHTSIVKKMIEKIAATPAT